MKYLKSYKVYESYDSDHYNGLTKEDIEDMFIDISDMGYPVSVILSIRLVNKDKKEGKTIFGGIPYIKVSILPKDKPIFTSMDVIERHKSMLDLKNSSEFKSLIEEVGDRVSDKDWYVSQVVTLQDSLKLLLYRKEDSKYIN